MSLKGWGVGMAPALYPLCLGFPIAVLGPAREFLGHTAMLSPSARVLFVYTEISYVLKSVSLSSVQFHCLA